MRRCSAMLTILLAILTSLVAAGAAQAVVLNDGGTEAGVSLLPSARGATLPIGVSAVSDGSPCEDPWLSTDLGGPILPTDALCYRGGSVVNKNETFALTWDAPYPDGSQRHYWSGTRGYVEQFLRDVADGSGTLTSPYALTQQYNDDSGRALNASIYGGGCIDYGVAGGSACEYGNSSSAGHEYPANGCPAGGDSFASVSSISPNTICLTDAQIQGELSTMVSQTGILGRTQAGYTPLVTLLLPPGVVACLDSSGTVCSVNSSLTPPPPRFTVGSTGGTVPAGSYQVEVTYMTASGETLPSAAQTVTTSTSTSTITISSPPPTAGVIGWYAYVTQAGETTFGRQQSTPTAIGSSLTLTAAPAAGQAPPTSTSFCSYHSQVDVDGTEVPYVVQPWTAGTGCDDPGLPNIQGNPTPAQLSTDVGQQLVSPISQAQISAIVDPGFDGWVAHDGAESEDNTCGPLPNGLDEVTVGSSSQNPYYLQREFDNGGALASDPYTYSGCAPNVLLSPAFVVPSAVDAGDLVEFDGSDTGSTLLVPRADYQWNFGDGTSAVGPSVTHQYGKGGDYHVTLTVTDRGGNVRTLSQTIVVLGPGGETITTTTGPGKGHTHSGLKVRIQLLPQGLKQVLRKGLAIRVTSNAVADGIASISISRSLAKRAHIKLGKKQYVVIGIGTLSGIKHGTVNLRLHLSKQVAKKLRRLHSLSLTVRLQLVAASGVRYTIDAAGRY